MANVCKKLSRSKYNSMKKFYEKTIQIKLKNKSFKMRIMQWNVLNQQNEWDKYFKHLSYLLT